VRTAILLLLGLGSVALTGFACAEVFVEKTVPLPPPGSATATDKVTSRQILVNGIASVGRSWTVHEDFDRYALRAARSVPQTKPFAPVVQLSQSALSIIQFQPAGLVRVLEARPMADGEATSVWEAQLKLADFFRYLDDTKHGVLPGRDHPLLGAPASARRANVVEVVGHDYNYSAVYVSAQPACALVADRTARLKALGATLDRQEQTAERCSASFTLAGRHAEFSAARARKTTELVMQTNIPPEPSLERLR